MADTKSKATDKKSKKPKRKLKAAPTFREQSAKQDAKASKPKRAKQVLGSKVFTPFRILGRGIKNAGSGIANSGFGKTVAKIYKSRVFAPVRFIGRILAKILFLSYFRNSWQELKLVTWPDNRTTWKLTGAVLVFAIVFGLLVAGLDFVLEKGFREVLLGS